MQIGIDPGLTGALASIRDGKVIAVVDIPTVKREVGPGQEVDARRLLAIIGMLTGDDFPHFIIERVRAMPRRVGGKEVKMGAQSMFNFGETFGVIRGVVSITGYPYTFVEPASWKRRAGLIGGSKEDAVELAKKLYPEASRWLYRKKDHNRADAILIAHFGIGRYEADHTLEDIL